MTRLREECVQPAREVREQLRLQRTQQRGQPRGAGAVLRRRQAHVRRDMLLVVALQRRHDLQG